MSSLQMSQLKGAVTQCGFAQFVLMPVCLSVQTIIECLKQACTGDLPPNTRSGQSFIHDPKVITCVFKTALWGCKPQYIRA